MPSFKTSDTARLSCPRLASEEAPERVQISHGGTILLNGEIDCQCCPDWSESDERLVRQCARLEVNCDGS